MKAPFRRISIIGYRLKGLELQDKYLPEEKYGIDLWNGCSPVSREVPRGSDHGDGGRRGGGEEALPRQLEDRGRRRLRLPAQAEDALMIDQIQINAYLSLYYS